MATLCRVGTPVVDGRTKHARTQSKKKHWRRAENKGLKQTRQLKCRRAAGKRRRRQSNAGISCSSLAPKLIVTPTPPTCTSLRHVGGATLLPRKLLPLLRQTTHLAAPPFTWSGEANGEKKIVLKYFQVILNENSPQTKVVSSH